MSETFPKTERRKHILRLTGGGMQERMRLASRLGANLADRGLRVLIVCPQGEQISQQLGALALPNNCNILFSSLSRGNGKDVLVELTPPGEMDGYDLVFDVASFSEDEGSVALVTDISGNNEPLFACQPGEDEARLAECILAWLAVQVMEQKVWGCVLIGGKSSRMGRPKHRIRDHRGATWVERIVAQLEKLVDRVVLAGKGDVPDTLHRLDRLTDISGAQGPIAGILAAMRWQPMVSWVVAACDMPAINGEGIDWLLGTRIPGVWGTVPRHPESCRWEPLLAYYDFRSRLLFENLLMQGDLKLSRICENNKIVTPVLPRSLAGCWLNCNTPEDLVALEKDHYYHT